MGGMPWYASREDVQQALDSESSAGTRFAIDSACAIGSRALERSAQPGLGRVFYPRYETRYEDWPDRAQTRTRGVYLGQPLISATSITAGGAALAVGTDAILAPLKDEPCAHLLKLASGVTLSSGGDWLRSIAIAGLFGYHDEQQDVGALDSALDSTATTLDLAGGGALLPGVGNLLQVDTERMIITDKRMIDTGVNLGTALTASLNDNTVSVADGTAFTVGETLLVGTERMWIWEIVGNSLYVRRAYDSTQLAAHSLGADILAGRRLVVERGAVGSTAAAHSDGATVTRWDCPAPVQGLALALAINEVAQRGALYSRTVGEGETQREVSGRGIRGAYDSAKGYRRPLTVYA